MPEKETAAFVVKAGVVQAMEKEELYRPYHTYWKNKKKSWPPKTLVPQNVKGEKRDIRLKLKTAAHFSSGDHAHFLGSAGVIMENAPTSRRKTGRQSRQHQPTVGFLQYNVEENKSQKSGCKRRGGTRQENTQNASRIS